MPALSCLTLGLVALSCESAPKSASLPAAPTGTLTVAQPDSLAVAHGQLGPGTGHILIGIVPPPGAELTVDAPISVQGSGGIGLHFPKRLKGKLSNFELPLSLPVEVLDGATGPAEIKLSYYWCTVGTDAACRRHQTHLSVELDLTGDAPGGEAHFEYNPSVAPP